MAIICPNLANLYAIFKTILMALEMTKALQTKCKTCFGGPRLILHAHKKNPFANLRFGFLFTLRDLPPPHSNRHSVAPIFGQNHANARLYMDISLKNRCHKPS